MAASVRLKTLVSIFLLKDFYLFLSFAVVSNDENSIGPLNLSVFGEETNTYFDLFNTSQPTELDSTRTPTVTDLSTAAEPTVPAVSSAEPLPISGRLPSPATDGESFICNKRCKRASWFVVLLLGNVSDCS